MKKKHSIWLALLLGVCLFLPNHGKAMIRAQQVLPEEALTLDGIDISNWQKGLDLSRIDAHFVLLKASGGTSWKDASFEQFARDALENGKLLGFYHFARESVCAGSPREEAQNFYETVYPYLGLGIPVLDFEGEALQQGTEWAVQFLDAFYSLSGVKPLIYTSAYYTRALDWSEAAQAGYQLWLAQYGSNEVSEGYQENPWTDGKGTGAFESHVMHQYSSRGRLPGWNGELDLNKFYGSVQDWKALCAIDDSVGTMQMYRMYNPNSGEHFYTKRSTEKDDLVQAGWTYEGVGWIAPQSGDPVYRLYNPNAGDHHYTLDSQERNHLIECGWNDEGIGWYSPDPKGDVLPVYRAYNPNAKAGAHNFTIDRTEQNHICSAGWRDEGIAWYALNLNSSAGRESLQDEGNGQAAQAGRDPVEELQNKVLNDSKQK